ncbi:response regulator transcription factor [Rapidithrix thailandica]|uniref:Response regulator transcription factor n=1 Tax=Rapidithrix thailandica TaxID=413964 RepID=A0AAW9RSH1_9BACT
MKILLVEDEQNIASFVKKGLTEQGYEVMVAYDGPMGLQLASQYDFDLIILDIILPGINGVEVCKKIRETAVQLMPILMLTALGTTENIVQGLDAGADDYLAKPFKFKELLARIRALTRRTMRDSSNTKVLNIADLELDTDMKIARRSGKEIKLTSREYRLLEYLMKHQRKVMSRIDILESVWDVNFDMGTNVVDVYVNYLRNKIDKDFSPKLIHTVIGMGYVMKEGEENR